MNEDMVGLLVRLVCGESAEPPLRGTVQIDERRFRVWKHGERLRVETPAGELCAIREADRLLTFHEETPLESGPESFGDDDEAAPWSLLARPPLHRLGLDERRLDGPVERGERFGRPTATLTLDPRDPDEPALTWVLDAATGMPLEVAESGEPLLRWLELEVVDAIDEELLRWDGETSSGGWFGYVGCDGEVAGDNVPDAVREQFRENARRSAELAASLDRSPLVASVAMEVQVSSLEPGLVAIDLESDMFVTVRGYASAGPDLAHGAAEVWTTADGWTWAVHATGVEDPELLPSLRERISTWRASLPGTPTDGSSGAR